MVKVQKLSGKQCLYYQRGRCTKNQPAELSEETRCFLIAERRRIGNRALDRLKRLERFGLKPLDPDRLVAERYIVESNLKEMARIRCKNYIESGVSFPFCLHQIYTLCLLKMAACPGRCPDFELYRREGSDDRSWL